MDRNIKIAKELVRLAKSLVAYGNPLAESIREAMNDGADDFLLDRIGETLPSGDFTEFPYQSYVSYALYVPVGSRIDELVEDQSELDTILSKMPDYDGFTVVFKVYLTPQDDGSYEVETQAYLSDEYGAKSLLSFGYEDLGGGFSESDGDRLHKAIVDSFNSMR